MPPRRLDRRALVARGHDQRLGPQIREIEVQLLGPVGRVQGGGGGTAGDGDEGRGHLRPVRQHDRHPVAAADAHRIERGHGRIRELAQGTEGQGRPLGGQDCGGIGGMGSQKVPDGLGHGVLGSWLREAQAPERHSARPAKDQRRT